jgi:hypothetical protein
MWFGLFAVEFQEQIDEVRVTRGKGGTPAPAGNLHDEIDGGVRRKDAVTGGG